MAGSAVPLPELAFVTDELLAHGQQPGEVSVQRPLRNPQQRGFPPPSAGLNGGQRGCPSGAGPDARVAIGTGTDVAVETADVVLMRSDPLDVATAITIGRGTRRKMRQNLAWAVGYNSIVLPVAGGALEPLGFTLSPAIGALSMSGSSVIVALNAVMLRGLRLPGGLVRGFSGRQGRAGASAGGRG